jgi:hypothetical protein
VPLNGATAGECEPARFESAGTGAPPRNSSSNYVPSLTGTDFGLGHTGPGQSRVVEGAIDGATHKKATEEACPAEDERASLSWGHVWPGVEALVPHLPGPEGRASSGTKLRAF